MFEYFSTAKVAGAPPPDFNGRWQNELNSEMELTVSGVKVLGKYRTGVGLPTPTEEFDLAGYINGDLVSFTVDFGKYGSLTSWVGQHTILGGLGIIKPNGFSVGMLWTEMSPPSYGVRY